MAWKVVGWWAWTMLWVAVAVWFTIAAVTALLGGAWAIAAVDAFFALATWAWAYGRRGGPLADDAPAPR